MIKFFRRIRQQLLSENRLSRYLIYAIGEIVLVVIGILIALQINNWNEERKKRILEQSYYCLLLEDVEEDILQLKDLRQKLVERIDAGNKALELVQGDSPDASALGTSYLLSIRNGTRTFSPNNSTFENIKSSGNLDVIRDKEVIKVLNRYFKAVEGHRSTILSNFEFDQQNLGQIDNWFESGLFNSVDYFYEDIFTPQIRQSLKEELPEHINGTIQPVLYNNLVMIGINNRRRAQLLNMIEEEVKVVHKALKNKCIDNQ